MKGTVMKTETETRWGALFLMLFALTMSLPALAAESSLSGAEIEAALAGNSVVGVKDGATWRQTFEVNGRTMYFAESAPPSNGKWRVDGGSYCSLWPPQGGWSCYGMTGDLDATPPTITFVGASGDQWPAEVRQGHQ